jgi:hypothetical protein
MNFISSNTGEPISEFTWKYVSGKVIATKKELDSVIDIVISKRFRSYCSYPIVIESVSYRGRYLARPFLNKEVNLFDWLIEDIEEDTFVDRALIEELGLEILK